MEYLLILIAFVLVSGNAFFVLAEFALVSVRSTRLEELVKKGRHRAKMAQFGLKHIDGYLSAIQLGISAISLGIGWIGEPALADIVHKVFPLLPFVVSKALSLSISFGIAFVLITGMHITLGEQVPKLIAIMSPEKALLLTIIPLTGFYYAAYGPMWLLNSIAQLILRILRFNPDKKAKSHSEDEIRILLAHREEEGKLSLDRLMMFENLFDFGHTVVKEIMTSRDNIAYLSLAQSWPDNCAIIRQRKFSKYPLCEKDLDSVIGYIHVKDIAFAFMDGNSDVDLARFKRNLLTMSDTGSLEECLRQFQHQTSNQALVIDTHRKVVGLVTVEDIIEEIIGEIRDEFEESPSVALSQVLVPDASVFDLSAVTRFEAVKTMLKKLHAISPKFDFNETLNLLYKREQGLPSAVGHFTAFPHARIASLAKPLVVFACAPAGIDFKAPDSQNVKLLFLIITPFYEPTTQLKILSQLARLISNETLRERLLISRSTSELMEIITSFEEKIPV